MNQSRDFQAFLAVLLTSLGCSGKLVTTGTADRQPEWICNPVPDKTPVTPKPCSPSAQPGRGPKVDLLFMIDNSSSMADKQEILSWPSPIWSAGWSIPRVSIPPHSA